MIALCLKSFFRYFTMWFRAFTPASRQIAPISFQRLCFLCILFPLFCLVQCIHWIGLLLDELLFSNYRKVEIQAPVFISGIPRSGTTFVHQTLATDTAQFTYFSTWEAALAPSICERKCIRFIGRIDQALGKPGKRLLDAILRKCTGNSMDSIHAIDLSAAEEDYLCLLPVANCFIFTIAFPTDRYLKQTGTLEQLLSAQREQVLNYYHRCLQRHLYCAPAGTRLLSKNAAFASWMPYLVERYPDAKSILCIRDPIRGLSSQLSSLAPARSLFGSDPTGEHTANQFLKLFQNNYKTLAKFAADPEVSNFVLIDQNDLKNQPEKVLRTALEKLQIKAGPALEERLNKLSPHKQGNHIHSATEQAIDASEIENCLRQPYEEILAAPTRIQP
jgi:hypothetical protein